MKLLNAVTANGDSAVFNIARQWRGDFRTCKVLISGTAATVTLKGKIDSDDTTWATLATFTASDIQAIVLPPQIMVTVSGISAATVSVWIDAARS